MSSGIATIVDQVLGRSRIPESARKRCARAAPPPSVQYLLARNGWKP